MSDGDDLDLSSLPDDELVTQMHEDLYDGLAPEIAEGTLILLDRGWAPDKVLNDALVEGMRIVGIDFRDGILFVPEVLLSANAMKAGMAILRPLLAETGAESVGKVVIGTVKGDIHDIGKNLVAMMLEGAGFEVVDLGINTDADKFLAAPHCASRLPDHLKAHPRQRTKSIAVWMKYEKLGGGTPGLALNVSLGITMRNDPATLFSQGGCDWSENANLDTSNNRLIKTYPKKAGAVCLQSAQPDVF